MNLKLSSAKRVETGGRHLPDYLLSFLVLQCKTECRGDDSCREQVSFTRTAAVQGRSQGDDSQTSMSLMSRFAPVLFGKLVDNVGDCPKSQTFLSENRESASGLV